MARIVFAPIPFSGHVNPGLPIVEALVRQGHEVRAYVTPRFKDKAESAGAAYLPYTKATVLDESDLERHFPERSKLKGIRQLKYDIKHVFLDQIPTLLADLVEELERKPADLILGDSLSGVCPLVRQRCGPKWVAYGVSVLPFSSRDTAPFGLAKLPQPGALGRMRNAGLNWMVPNLVFKDCYAHYEAISRRLGFPQPEFGLFDFARGADLFLQGSAPSFEYPRTDLPGNVRFIGATIPPPPARWSPPEWWRELDGSKPVVLVTQGTVANDYDDVLRPALRAMAGEDVVVIATTGSKPPSDLGMELPANARAAQFLPYAALMPKVDVMVTNGGYGSIQIALAHGVPVISFGVSEDKAEITNRVGWSGVGLGFKQKRAAEPQVRDAVRRVLGSPAFRKRAGEMQRELGTYRGPDFAAELVGSILGEPAVQSAGAGRP